MNLNGTPTNPGEMRTSIKLQKRVVVVSAGGYQSETWVDIGTTLAKWTNVHGGEVWQATAMGANAPATVWIRYNSQVDATCCVLKGERRYQIVSVDDVQERHEYMELKVKAYEAG